MKRFITFLKIVIALAAAVNIGLVFLTDDYTGFLTDLKNRIVSIGNADSQESGNIVPESESLAEEISENTFVFDPEVLVYDGTGSLNLLDGVSFGSLSAEEMRTGVFAKISAGQAANEKVITYSIDTDKGTVTAERKLKLENYSGPTLTLPASLPEISLSTLDTMASKVASSEGFSAMDGCGNDISSALACSYSIDPTNFSNITYNFSVTNMFGDSAYETASVSPVIDLPFIELAVTEATYSPSNPFPGYYSNVKRVVDTDGSLIGSLIKCEGEVNETVPGDYVLTYTVTNSAGLSAIPVSLTIHITE